MLVLLPLVIIDGAVLAIAGAAAAAPSATMATAAKAAEAAWAALRGEPRPRAAARRRRWWKGFMTVSFELWAS
jgi:hypothetical protein